MTKPLPYSELIDVHVEASDVSSLVKTVRSTSRDGRDRVVVVENTGEHPVEIRRIDAILHAQIDPTADVQVLELGLQSTDLDVGIVRVSEGDSYTSEHVAVVSLDGEQHLVIGYATSTRFLTSVRTSRTSASSLSFVATCLTESRMLEPGHSITSEVLVTFAGTSAHDVLGLYGDAGSELMGVRSRFTEPPTGWLSWYCFYGEVTEEDVLRQLDALAGQYSFARPKYVVVDSGWYSESGWGDWEPNAKFPHGMKWLADRIREAGFVPGLWFSPLLVSATSRLARERPELLLRQSDGRPVATMGTAIWDHAPEGAEGGVDVVEDADTVRFALDLGSDPVHQWLEDLFNRVRHEWGYEFVKLDFLIRALVTDRGLSPDRPGRGHDVVGHSGVTAVEGYRRALATIRRAVGEDCFILGCAAPLVASAGDLIDANRMTPDITRRNYGDTPLPGRPSSWDLVVICARSLALRYAFNGRLGWNDPDVLVVRDRPIPGISDSFSPTVSEAQIWTTIVAATGGITFLGDDLSRLTAERREITQLAFPPLPTAAVPWDLLTAPAPRIWINSSASFGYTQPARIAVINWNDDQEVVEVPMAALEAAGVVARDGISVVDLWSGEETVHGAPSVQGLPVSLPGRSAKWLQVVPLD
ncbi:glycoside hydrolase family 36 protein [Microbacterium dauci]|uniref:Alpha-galactosidase n=1 Tax=Microbacterium dauci TaxID=3048008 RepID=A0ABT6ZH72_9MICO|nr:glycoside hydrolase family 36 protein [Microbacterium sp. LX3-4]MDJ1115095.1 alpha-galactosidase [Microbacterium sp. LX3-4]